MPSKVGQKIATALTDKRLSKQDVADIVTSAKTDSKYTAEVKAEVAALLNQPASSFEAGAKADLQKFLDSTPVVVDLADPKVLDKHATSVEWAPVAGGKLYVDDVSYDDVVQGAIGDCYLAGALAAVARANPKAIKDAITDNGDGTYSVRFYQKNFFGKMTPVSIKVDGDVASTYGSAKYAHARDGKELWVGLLEKAYAQWKGGYEAIGNGGVSGDVMAAIVGKAPGYTLLTKGTQDATFNSIKRWTESGRPVSAGTYGKDAGVDYSSSGVYAWHVYTVLGASEENGVKYVQLRNPWGSTEPGSDGKNDGIFKMKLDDFTKWYRGVHYTMQ